MTHWCLVLLLAVQIGQQFQHIGERASFLAGNYLNHLNQFTQRLDRRQTALAKGLVDVRREHPAGLYRIAAVLLAPP
jgi:hypothetical protein